MCTIKRLLDFNSSEFSAHELHAQTVDMGALQPIIGTFKWTATCDVL